MALIVYHDPMDVMKESLGEELFNVVFGDEKIWVICYVHPVDRLFYVMRHSALDFEGACQYLWLVDNPFPSI